MTTLTVISHEEADRPVVVQLPIAMMFVAVVTIPTLLFYFGLSSSLALGSTIIALLVIMVAIASPNRLRSPMIRSLCFIGTVAFCIMLHLTVASLLYTVDAWHAAASLVPLAIIIVGGRSSATL